MELLTSTLAQHAKPRYRARLPRSESLYNHPRVSCLSFLCLRFLTCMKRVALLLRVLVGTA